MRRTLAVVAVVALVAGVYVWRRRRHAHVRITAAMLALTSLYAALKVK
jgi:hypothetical protein